MWFINVLSRYNMTALPTLLIVGCGNIFVLILVLMMLFFVGVIFFS